MVLQESLILAAAGFVPGMAVTYGVRWLTRGAAMPLLLTSAGRLVLFGLTS